MTKESITFLLFSISCLAFAHLCDFSNVGWGCDDDWSTNAMFVFQTSVPFAIAFRPSTTKQAARTRSDTAFGLTWLTWNSLCGGRFSLFSKGLILRFVRPWCMSGLMYLRLLVGIWEGMAFPIWELWIMKIMWMFKHSNVNNSNIWITTVAVPAVPWQCRWQCRGNAVAMP
jgi:hypothetical protein